MIRVGIVAYEAVDELDLAGLYGPLSKASGARESGGLQVMVLGPNGSFRGSGGLRMQADMGYAAPETAHLDVLALPGGRGAATASSDPQIRGLLACARQRGVPVYAVCTGALLLSDLGLLRGMTVAAHGAKATAVAREGGCRTTHGLVRDRWLVSAGGFGPGEGLKSIEVAYAILRDFAPDTVESVACRMEVWPGRPRSEVGARA